MEVEMPSNEPLVKEFTDGAYWRSSCVTSEDLDDLLADYE